VTTLEAKTTPRATDLLARLDKVAGYSRISICGVAISRSLQHPATSPPFGPSPASMSSLKRPKPFN
jgi:hypothetical protein